MYVCIRYFKALDFVSNNFLANIHSILKFLKSSTNKFLIHFQKINFIRLSFLFYLFTFACSSLHSITIGTILVMAVPPVTVCLPFQLSPF